MLGAEALLTLAARHGKVLLILGLLGGLASPGLAQTLRPWIPEFVTVLLALSAFRIGAKDTIGSFQALPDYLGLILISQLALPLSLAGLFWLSIGLDHPLAWAVILMTAAPSITGASHFALMLGHRAAPSLRLLIIGTTLLPLTLLPVLWCLPIVSGPAALLEATTRLLLTIAGSVACAFFIRARFAPNPTARLSRGLDGLAAILLALMVIGLMTAVGPALRQTPVDLSLWLSVAFATNFALQFTAFYSLTRLGWGPDAPAATMSVGNRNIALLLVALPAAATDPWLLFIGCYQIPMYLTPTLLRRLFASAKG